MNITHLEHLIIGLVIQGLFVLGFNALKRPDGVWYGAFFVTALFLGREHAQREYKIGDPSQLVGYEALDLWRWSLDAQLDFFVPTVAVFLVAGLVAWFKR
ncbi:hypothetical protein GGR41_000322 [Paenalcaligenes hominis]|uniref:Uncharacterized protein n=1 Tax=Paenalcaligenes hominis TaxID=643674 RepID=A0ABX0WPF1_9BURK|nr:hypothetical protein [Paenalcaligenes hominis]NJB64101.1 hypothetical protein [Paenalcaligenes hominis]GGE63064.1 hypothetical protein GCM10007278_09240 [Paenalcaligenes hominis]